MSDRVEPVVQGGTARCCPSVAVPLDGPPESRTPKLAHECTVAGVRAIALPPGPVELHFMSGCHMLNTVPAAMRSEVLRVNGENFAACTAPADSISWQPANADFSLRTENAHWEPIIEVDPHRFDALAHEALGGRRPTGEFVYWTHDPLVAAPSAALIAALRTPEPDPLYVEGLAMALIARGLHLAAEDLHVPSPRGADRRIARAIEHAEAHLDAPLSLAALATVAAMSPYHFVRCFREATGQTPAAWVQGRRVARARRLLVGPLPLAQIAHSCGFASQSHFGEVFKRHVGATPGAYRERVRG